jgi:Icc-related predicted phosphoesterase
MRMLIVSDLHYALRKLDWVLECGGDYDVVVLAGDHLSLRSAAEPDAQITVVLEYLARLAAKTTVVACSGNHDLNAHNEHDERAALWLQEARAAGVFVDGSRFATDDVVVTVCPWWDGPRTRADVGTALAEDAAIVGDRMWIWVYHAPPDGSPTSWTGRRHYGDADLNAWIEQYRPALVCCGHVHESPFADAGSWSDRLGATFVVNAGSEPGPVPPHIIVDTGARAIRAVSSQGVDDASFAPA